MFLLVNFNKISLIIPFYRPPPVKVGACRALSQLLPDATRGIIQHHGLDLFSALIDLLKNVR